MRYKSIDQQAFEFPGLQGADSGRQQAIAEAEKVVADMEAAKKQREDARGLFKNKKKAAAQQAMVAAAIALSKLMEKYAPSPYLADIYPIVKPYLGEEGRQGVEQIISSHQIQERQEVMQAGFEMKTEYMAYAIGGLLLVALLKKSKKEDKED